MGASTSIGSSQIRMEAIMHLFVLYVSLGLDGFNKSSGPPSEAIVTGSRPRKRDRMLRVGCPNPRCKSP